MAEKPKAKRLVKNPETFRERAVKATTEGEKPKRTIKTVSGKVTSPVLGPVGRLSSKVWKFGPIKLLHKPLRLIGLVLFPRYFRKSWQELKQVNWPNWQQSRRLTFSVLFFAIIFGALIAVVDFGLDKAFRSILLK